MATKKVRRDAVPSANRKPLPKKGDAVWIERGCVLGIFVAYSASEKVVTLNWPAEVSFMNIWPATGKSIFGVERKDIRVLSPAEILAKVALLAYRRDRKERERVVDYVRNNAADRFLSRL